MFPIEFLYKMTFDRCLSAGALYEFFSANPDACPKDRTEVDVFNHLLVMGEKPYTEDEFTLAASMVLDIPLHEEHPWTTFVNNWKETIADSSVKMQLPISGVLEHLQSIVEDEQYPWVCFVGNWIDASLVYAHAVNTFAENWSRLLDIGLSDLPDALTDTWVGWPDKPNQKPEVSEVIQLAYNAMFDNDGKFRSLVPGGLVPNVPLYIKEIDGETAIGIEHRKGVVWINFEPE